jgi:hypothetical protein
VVQMTTQKSLKKVKLSLCYIKHYAVKTYGGSGGISQPLLTSAVHVGEWLASRCECFAPEQIVTGTHWIGGWVGHRSGLDAMEKR